jgi:hypothetical protein
MRKSSCVFCQPERSTPHPYMPATVYAQLSLLATNYSSCAFMPRISSFCCF